MPISVGSIVRPFIDSCEFKIDQEVNFQCTGDKTDICVGIVTSIDDSEGFTGFNPKLKLTVKWLQRCEVHSTPNQNQTLSELNGNLWQIGQIY